MELSMPLQSAGLERVTDANSDEALVSAARGGNYQAFETLFLRYRQMVYRYSFQMVGKRDDAEDLVQEVFVRAYQNLHRYRDEAKFTTWLLRIATNLATDRARMHQRRTNLEQQEAGTGLAWMTVGETDDPVKNLTNEYRVQVLRKALAALPEHHRSLIVMRDLEGREYEDIANILGCSVGGAKLRALRARRALKERMEPFLEGYSG